MEERSVILDLVWLLPFVFLKKIDVLPQTRVSRHCVLLPFCLCFH